ncbi:2-dehydropantoate 2-reductase [Pseudoalteromonas tunicata]|jgi:2-dehydropantoate 2-reductase|uniref:2-dehydropantoate 2-reductase n=1 Tax=Pseudoalteromonas tunicata D2 TaxID=87626 RepID=A4CDM7_9GAMM|nr:2-dehydropantoate 2-reductase [Pseudoalteromonas tunicata]ATC96441.1 hypothetical protein PTUN_a4244 [Pseudoalteromonas tunicata]AXT31926.1 2-dehydropantoate 2-reductase [Pseudoalteromonas tunicata]EAR27069.1 2-dehydropantoate 2-reductase [Pseudoalteromonas tunicata D2]
MKILIVGCGGIGGYFGARLIEAGADITFLVRHARQQMLAQTGLNLISCRGNSRLTVKTVTNNTLSSHYDLIVLTCKSYDLAACIEDIRPAVSDTTLILPLLNGLNHYAQLQQAFSTEQVLFGYCNISVGLNASNQIEHFNAIHELSCAADAATAQSSQYQSMLTLFKQANFNTRTPANIHQELWEKFVFINTLAATTTLMNANIGTIMACDYGQRYIESTLLECQAVAEQVGYPVRARADKMARDAMLVANSTFSASMHKDMQAGRPVELENLLGNLLEHAHDKNVPTPLLEAAFNHLQIYQAQQLNREL